MATIDDLGEELGYCNSCGEEAEMYSECCEDGEVVAHDDEPEPSPKTR